MCLFVIKKVLFWGAPIGPRICLNQSCVHQDVSQHGEIYVRSSQQSELHTSVLLVYLPFCIRSL